MTKREKFIKTRMQKNISQMCESITPVAKQVYYTPAYHKQKEQLSPKFPLKKLIDKDEILDIQRDIISGNDSEAASKLRDLNTRLEDFESRMNAKVFHSRRRKRTI